MTGFTSIPGFTARLLTALFCTLFSAQACLAEGSESLQFIVLGDWGRHGEEGQLRVARQMNALASEVSIDFIVSTGDNFYERGVESVDDASWKSSFEQVYSLPALESLPWYISLGNHDYLGNIRAQIAYSRKHPLWVLPATYHEQNFQLKSRNFLKLFVIDTTALLDQYRDRPETYRYVDEAEPARQLNWLYRRLGKSEVDWNIVIGHHPLRSAGHHGNSVKLEKQLGSIFRQAKVHAYFAGHDHHLEHIKTESFTQYFISGGGSRIRPVSRSEKASLFVASSLGFSHVVLTATCMRVRFINERGEEVYRSSHRNTDMTPCNDPQISP